MIFWSFWGSLFGRLWDHFWCQEAVAHEKGEHVILDESSAFLRDFQGPDTVTPLKK